MSTENAAVAVCGRCRATSSLVEHFSDGPSGVFQRGRICPWCREFGPHVDMRAARLLSTISTPILLIMFLAGGLALESEVPFFGLVVRVLLLMPLLIVGHEVSHALATRLVNGRLFEVCIGFGQTLGSLRIGGLVVSFRSGLFDGGYCVAGFTSATPVALWRWFAIYGAGISFHAIAAVAGALLIDESAWRSAFVVGNLLMLAINVVPRHVNGLRSDGMQLWRLARVPEAEPELRAGLAAAAAGYAQLAGDDDEAARRATAAYQAFPESLAACAVSVALHAQRGDMAAFDESVERWRNLLPPLDVAAVDRGLLLGHPVGRQWIANCRITAYLEADDVAGALAWVRTQLADETHPLAREYLRADAGVLEVMLTGQSGEATAALAECDAAFAVLPWAMDIAWARATALALVGRDDEAVAAANLAKHYDLTGRPVMTHRYIHALADARRGDLDRAKRLLRPFPPRLLAPYARRALADAGCPVPQA